MTQRLWGTKSMTDNTDSELPPRGKAIVLAGLVIGLACGWGLNMISPIYGVIPGMLFSIVGAMLGATLGVKIARRVCQ
jgi:hypothetical protein